MKLFNLSSALFVMISLISCTTLKPEPQITTSIINSVPRHPASQDIYFPTQLDKPKVLLVDRDSINYRLSDQVILALEKINKQRSANEQIQLITMGRQISETQYLESIDNLRTSARPNLPDLPFVDINKKNDAIRFSWFTHVPYIAELWVQDAYEFFYENNVLKALQFKPLFVGQSLQTIEEKKRMDQLSDLTESDDPAVTEEMKDNYFKEYSQINNMLKERAEKYEIEFLNHIKIQEIKKLVNLDAEGGDLEFLPERVALTSISKENGLQDIKSWLSQTQYNNRIIELDADWFEIGHVDEFVSIVPAKNECGFSVLALDPELGLNLVKKEVKTLEELIPKAYHSSSPPGGSLMDSDLPELYKEVRDSRAVLSEKSKSASIRLQFLAKKRIARLLNHLQKEYARLNPRCKSLQFVYLPTLVGCKELSSMDTCGTLLSNPVNSVVLDKDLLVPDPFLPLFRQEINRRLSANGLTTHFVDSSFYHGLLGEAHCASNVIREKSH